MRTQAHFDNRLQERAIERLIQLHKLNYISVDFQTFSRKYAIYLLQGAAITPAINARKLRNEVGMLGREWRYISEVAYTIEYFDELADDSRELVAWFRKDGVIERKPKKSGVIDSSKRQEKSHLEPQHYKQFDELHKRVANSLSVFAHATYSSAIGNTSRNTRRFDYHHTEEYDEDPSSLQALKGVFVSEAISCFLYPVWSLPIAPDHYRELIEYKQTLQERSTRAFPETS